MTLMDLQDAICAVLPHVFRNVRLEVRGGDRKTPDIHMQMIPFIDYNDEADGLERRAPCCTVFVSDSATDENDSERDPGYPVDVAKVFLCFVVYDNERLGQGHRDLMMLFELVKQYFRANPSLSPNFWCRRKMRFILDSREEAPIFSSAMEMDFEMRMEEAESELI